MKPAIVYPIVALEIVPSCSSSEESDIDIEIQHAVLIPSAPLVIPVPFEDVVHSPYKRMKYRGSGNLVSLINNAAQLPSLPLPSLQTTPLVRVPLFSTKAIDPLPTIAPYEATIPPQQKKHTVPVDVDYINPSHGAPLVPMNDDVVDAWFQRISSQTLFDIDVELCVRDTMMVSNKSISTKVGDSMERRGAIVPYTNKSMVMEKSKSCQSLSTLPPILLPPDAFISFTAMASAV